MSWLQYDFRFLADHRFTSLSTSEATQWNMKESTARDDVMETFSVLLALCAWNSPVTGEFLVQRPVTRSFSVFFDLHLYKRMSKQWWGWWFEMPSRSSWRHCNVESNDISQPLQSENQCSYFTDFCTQFALHRIFVVMHRAIFPLTHWGRVAHICHGKLAITGSDNGLSPHIFIQRNTLENCVSALMQ